MAVEMISLDRTPRTFGGHPFPKIIAAHESPRTTKLYDRTRDEITLHEVERILI